MTHSRRTLEYGARECSESVTQRPCINVSGARPEARLQLRTELCGTFGPVDVQQGWAGLETPPPEVPAPPAFSSPPPEVHAPPAFSTSLGGAYSSAAPVAPTPPQAVPVAFAPQSDEATGSEEHSGVYREAALRARFGEAEAPALVAVNGSRWTVLAILLSLLLLLIAGARLGRVEVTSTAQGAIQVENGPRPVLVQVSGRVVELSVRSGERVTQGQELGRVDATDLRARILRQERELEQLTAENARLWQQSVTAHEAVVGAMKKKRALLVERVRVSESIVQNRLANSRRARAQVEQGVGAQVDAATAAIEFRASQDQLLSVKQAIADLEIELAEREKALNGERATLERAERQLATELAESKTLFELASIRSPEDGVLESVLVSRGQVVEAGTLLGRVVPTGALTRVVAFVPARDAAFVRAGIEARVELPSLPVGEFGRLRARVTRVSADIATQQEITEALGNEAMAAAAVRVELELLDDPEFEAVSERLRSGARVIARLQTRRVPIFILLFEFLRKWYPE